MDAPRAEHPAFAATESDRAEDLAALLASADKADLDLPGPDGVTLLMSAVAHRSVQCAKLLLGLGADPHAISDLHGGMRALDCLFRGPNTSEDARRCASLLLAHGSRPGSAPRARRGEFFMAPLSMAALDGDALLRAALAWRGAPLDEIDPEGRSALHFATVARAWTVVEALVEGGAEPTQRFAITEARRREKSNGRWRRTPSPSICPASGF